jgi:hypothetical protein
MLFSIFLPFPVAAETIQSTANVIRQFDSCAFNFVNYHLNVFSIFLPFSAAAETIQYAENVIKLFNSCTFNVVGLNYHLNAFFQSFFHFQLQLR